MKFHWTATDARGNRHTGVSEAASEREMVAQLRSRALLPQTIKQQRPRTTLRAFSARISHGELTLFTRQLATLIAAALPLDEALAVVQQQKEIKNWPTSSALSISPFWKGSRSPWRCKPILVCLIRSFAPW